MRSIFWMSVALVGIACGDSPQEDPVSSPAKGAKEPPARGVDALSNEERENALSSVPGLDARAVQEAKVTLNVINEELTESAEPELPSVPCSIEQPTPAPELLDPSQWTQTAPDTYNVLLDTTAGEITLAVTRSWSPVGADRFFNLVQSGYLTDIAWFRVVPDFVAQGGMHGNPQVNKVWGDAKIQDDPVVQSNRRGTVSFATSGENSRSNQFFINFKDNARLDGMGFSPFAEVVQGMEAVDAFYSSHPDIPDQGMVGARGSAFLCSKYPELDRILTARVVD